jgi:hypothetical protein
MKKWVFLILVALIFPQYISATCYMNSDSGYASCVGNRNAKRCQSTSGGYYACCNEIRDVCPTETGQNQTLSPLDDDTCGQTSQRCCSGKKCDNNSLECRTTYNGDYCLDQGQIRELGGGSAKTTTNTSTESPLCGGDKGVKTAFGCLMAGDPKAMVSQLLGWGAIVGAGIAFVMIVIAGLQIILAGGDPKKVQAARELITSAITGLLLIIFSVLLLNFIGVKILGLSSLGFNL